MNATTNIQTAEKYRQLAQDCYRRTQESWERSDNDGFLSQWASDQMAGIYNHNALVVDAGGVESSALVEIETGEIVATMADYKEGQYGWYYLIRDDAVAARIGRFISTSNASKAETREANNAKKGVRVVTVMVPLADCYESRKTGRIEVHSYENAQVTR